MKTIGIEIPDILLCANEYLRVSDVVYLLKDTPYENATVFSVENEEELTHEFKIQTEKIILVADKPKHNLSIETLLPLLPHPWPVILLSDTAKPWWVSELMRQGLHGVVPASHFEDFTNQLVRFFNEYVEKRKKDEISPSLNHIIRNTNSLIVLLDDELQVLDFSTSFLKETGYAANQLKAIPFSDLIHNEDWESVVKPRLYSLQSGESRNGELRYRLQYLNGQYHWFKTTADPIFNHRNELIGFITISSNIDSEAKAELVKLKWNQRTTMALDTTNALIWEMEIRNKMFWISPPMQSRFKISENISLADFLKRIESILHPEDADKIVDLSRIFENPNTVEIHEYFTKNPRSEMEFRVMLEGSYRDFQTYLQYFPGNSMEEAVLISANLDVTDLKKIEEDRNRTNIRFKALFELDTVGVFSNDSEGNCNAVNAEYARLCGKKPENCLGMQWLDAIHPEDRSRVQEIWELYKTQEISPKMEYRLLHPDGKTVWVLSNSRKEKDEKGNVLGYLGTITDITEIKESEKALRDMFSRLREAQVELEKTQMRLARISNMVPVGIYRTDEEGNSVYVNGTLADITNSTQERLLKNEWVRHLHPEDREGCIQAWNEAITEQKPFNREYRFVFADKQERWVVDQAIPETDENGQFIGHIGAITEITERKKAELEIQHRQRQLEEVINHDNALVFVKDVEGKFLIANKRIKTLFGNPLVNVTDYDLLGQDSYTRIIHQNDQEVIKTGKAKVFEESAYIRGKLRHFLSSKAPFTNLKGEVVGITCLAIDVTNTVESDKEIARLNDVLLRQFNQLKRYTYINSHDLRAPVTNLLGIANLLHQDPTAFNHELLESLYISTEKLDSVVKELNELLRNADFIDLGGDITEDLQIHSICLIDDDPIQHLINKRVIRDIDPKIEVITYIEADKALADIRDKVISPDLILLDINMPVMNGWDFLIKMEDAKIDLPVHMLTSSIDPSDQQKSKEYKKVKGFLSKPLRKEVLKTIL